MATVVKALRREDFRKSFAAFAKRGFVGCNDDCVMDEAIRRIFVCNDTESSYCGSQLYDLDQRMLGSVSFNPIADVPNAVRDTHPFVYDEACLAAARGDRPKNADEIYRHVINTLGKLVEFKYDENKISLR